MKPRNYRGAVLISITFFFIVFMLTIGATAQNLKLPAIFSDNMILQRDIAIPIWGECRADADISVSISEITWKGKSGGSGKWMTKIPPQKAGGPFILTVESGGEKIAFRNVMFGDVWVCSGQSNMVWTLSKSLNGEKETQAANHPDIRLFTIKRQVADSPLSDTEGIWAVCSPSTVKDFSGVGYFFGKEIHKNIDVPIGLIQSAWGGTPIEAWMSGEGLKSDPDFLPIHEKWKELIDSFPDRKNKHDIRLLYFSTFFKGVNNQLVKKI